MYLKKSNLWRELGASLRLEKLKAPSALPSYSFINFKNRVSVRIFDF